MQIFDKKFSILCTIYLVPVKSLLDSENVSSSENMENALHGRMNSAQMVKTDKL